MPTRTKGYLITTLKAKNLIMYPEPEKHCGYAMSWWKRYSYQLRATNPKCNKCEAVLNPRQLVVDHVIPVSYGGSFEDTRNHQVLCIQCHNVKTASEREQPLTASQRNEQGKLIPS